jgi:hypothetical protein
LLLFQDTDGKIIAQSSGTKMATLEEGSRLYVGNKEVEVTPETHHCLVPNSCKNEVPDHCSSTAIMDLNELNELYTAAHFMKIFIPLLIYGSATQTELISVLRRFLKSDVCFTTINEMCRLYEYLSIFFI